MNRGRLTVGLSVIVLSMLAVYSGYLALHRIFQVDEFQNLYMARVQATGHFREFYTNSSLFLFGPLAWLATSSLSSVAMITRARVLFVVLFWINLLLLARIAGGRLTRPRGLAALIAAATLAPLWDYGFEVRHDNVILTGILLIWWLVRARRPRTHSYVIAAVIAVALLFIAAKAVVYVVPLSVAIVAIPPPGAPPRRKAVAAWLIGAGVTVALVRLCYGNSGAWANYVAAFHRVSEIASERGSEGRFSAWGTLSTWFTETPLLLAVTAAALISIGARLARREQAALGWDGLLPESLLFLGALVALLINPTPFPYNLVNLVPFAFVLAFKFAIEAGRKVQLSEELSIFFLAIVFFAHFAPFALLTSRHLQFTNARQEQLMELAEDVTDSSHDLVYDAVGMVPTRWSADFHWYLHSLSAQLLTTPGSRVRDFLAARPAAVFVPSYRTDWLPEADKKFIESRYVHLADDFEVLGTILPAGGGSFETVHAGRYSVVAASARGQPTTEPITGVLDGDSLAARPVTLAVGKHDLRTQRNTSLAVVWVGPRLNWVPALSPGDHRLLFQNWY